MFGQKSPELIYRSSDGCIFGQKSPELIYRSDEG
jgi:hypothetical protein